eukprot:1146716-Pelagomonas_calceolata.AAC.1
MRIWRVGRHAPGRPDSHSPALLRHAPSTPPPQVPWKWSACLVLITIVVCWIAWQLNLDASDLAFCLVKAKLTRGFCELRVLSLGKVLACWAVAVSRVEKGLVSGQNSTRWISMF